jgi:L-iditol 2-dehydrogenase
MKALRLHADGRAQLEEVSPPALADDGVLVRVSRAGVCGTDVEILHGDYPSRAPVTMGHEYAGIVAAVGSSVQSLRPGDRVASRASWGCRRCPACAAGRAALCPERRMLGSTADGAFAEFVQVPAQIVIPLPPGLDFDSAQAIVPLAVCLHAIGRIRLPDARRVAVIGPGTVGLLLVQALRSVFGGRVTLFGTRDERLTIGRQWVDATVNVRAAGLEAHAGEFELVFEAAGTPSSFQQSLEFVAPGGTVCVLGVTREPVPHFAPFTLYSKELSIVGSKGGAGHYEAAIAMFLAGDVSVDPLISHRFPLDRAAEALATAANRNAS